MPLVLSVELVSLPQFSGEGLDRRSTAQAALIPYIDHIDGIVPVREKNGKRASGDW